VSERENAVQEDRFTEEEIKKLCLNLILMELLV
jgi:hypothetical protein